MKKEGQAELTKQPTWIGKRKPEPNNRVRVTVKVLVAGVLKRVDELDAPKSSYGRINEKRVCECLSPALPLCGNKLRHTSYIILLPAAAKILVCSRRPSFDVASSPSVS